MDRTPRKQLVSELLPFHLISQSYTVALCPAHLFIDMRWPLQISRETSSFLVRACRNAIEFNSLSIDTIIPGGYEGMKLNVILAVPGQYQDGLDLEEVRKVFPYGDINFVIQNGGMVAPSGRQIEALGDTNDDMIIVCAAVQVGY